MAAGLRWVAQAGDKEGSSVLYELECISVLAEIDGPKEHFISAEIGVPCDCSLSHFSSVRAANQPRRLISA